MESVPDDQVILVSTEDGTKVSVSKQALRLSGFLTNLLECYEANTDLLVPDISGEMLKSLCEFLDHYKSDDPRVVVKPLREKDIKSAYGEWEAEFVAPFTENRDKIKKLMEIADTIDCKPLLELCASAVALHIQELPVSEMLEYLGLKENLTEDEHKKLIEEFNEKRAAEIEMIKQKDIETNAINTQLEDEDEFKI